jgi:hypothetical protein
MHTNYQSLRRDGLGDDGERLRTVATALAERGWSDGNIKQRVMTDPACVHPAWDDRWVQQEIEACISKVRPLEPKPLEPEKKVTQISDAGLPGWLRDRIESVAIPEDRDLHFRDVVTALAVRGWDSFRITIAIAGRVWIPERYAGHLEEWGIKPVIAAQAWVPLRSIDEAAPNATQSNAAADVERVAVQTNVADVAACDLRAVQRAIASGRWRENSQAKEWAGHAVATVIGLDASNKAHKAKIAGLLKTWIANGMLAVVDGEDDKRQKRKFVEVGTSADN